MGLGRRVHFPRGSSAARRAAPAAQVERAAGSGQTEDRSLILISAVASPLVVP